MEKFVSFFLVLLVFLFSACAISARGDKPAPYEKYVDEIISSFAKDMNKEYGLVCVGSGGRMPHDVEEITIFFDAYRHATVEEARELFVNVTEKLIDKINSHEKIRPFLREYPITSRNADNISTWCRAHVYISFQKKDGSHYLDGSVASISQGKGGEIYYRAAELRKRIQPDFVFPDGKVKPSEVVEEEKLTPFMHELYEEARAIVRTRR